LDGHGIESGAWAMPNWRPAKSRGDRRLLQTSTAPGCSVQHATLLHPPRTHGQPPRHGGASSRLRGGLPLSEPIDKVPDVSDRRSDGDPHDETLTDDQLRACESREVVAPQLVVAIECDRFGAGPARHSLANIDEVVLGRGPARSCRRSFDGATRTLQLRVQDGHMSQRHARLVRRGTDFAVADEDSRNGTRVNGTRIDAATELGDGDLVEAGHTLFRYRTAVSVPLGEPADVDASTLEKSLLPTLDAGLAKRVAGLDRVARSTVPVLLLGETGTGKEVLARALHLRSERAGPFVAVNCGALPVSLVEAQLFGHVRGAFSGANDPALGLFRSAHRGTLLLDEIGDLSSAGQVALLRVLQEHEVVPVGSAQPITIDLRVIAATHRPLERLVAEGQFRDDLLARLTGFRFILPPLRERRDDVGLLVAAFLADRRLRLTTAAGRAILRWDWPQNARELRQALGAASALADNGWIDLAHLPSEVAECAAPEPRGATPTPAPDPLVDELISALARHHGNISEVAREMRKARVQIQRWIKRFAIDAASFRSGGRLDGRSGLG
jgi:transcriptional regulator of acetoin/glycerol metabolism